MNDQKVREMAEALLLSKTDEVMAMVQKIIEQSKKDPTFKLEDGDEHAMAGIALAIATKTLSGRIYAGVNQDSRNLAGGNIWFYNLK
jgi:hypothetical protein